ncbi:C-reactive protein 1.4-like [Centruroides sculpturatus]|uniref:C-reactive protein 1.4-like n=1 Tax=Centruroides sculpturatus TaxID=218467 RepID=UPI000C6E9D71|nr:C-reactive protein 1.4-like [Centruroides sculpturatus]
MIILTFISFSILLTSYAAEISKFSFPPSNATKFPRLRPVNTFPTLQEFTFCSRVRPVSADKNRYFTILSYATARSNSEIVINVKFDVSKSTTAHIYLKTSDEELSCDGFNDMGMWNSICISWFGPNGRIQAVINSKFCSINLAADKYIEEGGAFIIGQKQDVMDSEFDLNQSWEGDIADIHLWNEAFDVLNTIKDDRYYGIGRAGNVVSLEYRSFIIFDGVIIS